MKRVALRKVGMRNVCLPRYGLRHVGWSGADAAAETPDYPFVRVLPGTICLRPENQYRASVSIRSNTDWETQ